VTGAETCELALALAAAGRIDAGMEQVAAMQHLRHEDGSYWTGFVYPDGVRWPVERTTWTAAAVVLAADALSAGTAASGLFRDVSALARGDSGTDVPAPAAGDAGSPVR
ncbi:MAG: prenyltransferase, partial [Actinomycetes bacterium]